MTRVQLRLALALLGRKMGWSSAGSWFGWGSGAGSGSGSACSSSEEDRRLVEEIRRCTAEENVNNVTRTRAYLEMYRRRPELHWAFLGHMVSRNGGWNMTDLHGEWLPRLMSEGERANFFAFLERGNWLIFQDVYPQFLVYEESLRRERPMFHLLRLLGVSVFMQVVWREFWRRRDEPMLAIALIINEQSYLERQVMHDSHYVANVLKTPPFLLQDVLSLNHILFPFDGAARRAEFVGQTLNHFGSLRERIRLGKRLYRVLFGDPEVLAKVEAWAAYHPHTGSRSDYWPHLFGGSASEATSPWYPSSTEHPSHFSQSILKKVNRSSFLSKKVDYNSRPLVKVHNCELAAGATQVYSPRLEDAWGNVEHLPAEQVDWFESLESVRELGEWEGEVDGDIGGKYCETLEKIQIAAVAAAAKKFVFRINFRRE